MEVVKFTETAFTATGKKGILVPDADGYYSMVVGALNTYNSAKEYYTAKGALELFESSSQFMRRIKNGALYSELGHPKKDPKISIEQFYSRVVSIEETNVCAHFSEIVLDFEFGKKNPQINNPDLIAIVAKVKPAGPKANAVQLAFENPKQNSAFSIRGLTENKYVNGRTERRLTNIITFDFVNEPGISVADKFMSPSLESNSSYVLEELMDTIVDVETLKRIITSNMTCVSMESDRDRYAAILQSLTKKSGPSRLSAW